MMPFLERASLVLIYAAMSSAVRSLALAGVAAAALAAFRPRATSFRLFAWTSVLYTSLALPLLRPLLPAVKVPVPQFLKARIASGDSRGTKSLEDGLTVPTRPASSEGDRKPASHRQAVPLPEFIVGGTRHSVTNNAIFAPPTLSWNLIAAALYLAGAFLFLARFVAGMVWSSRLLCDSELIAEPFAIAKATSLAGRHVPRLASCEHISVPLTVGVLRPTILLPSDWREWEVQKFDAVLAHELAHVARHDALTQHMAQLYRTIFWFNPLAWWLNRHLATLAEQASDEAALSTGADQTHYARTLLDFFDALETSPGRVRWQGVSMARAGQAEQRLERILAWKGTVTMHLKRPLAAAIIVLAVPFVYLAASVRASNLSPAVLNADESQQAPAPQAPPAGSVSTVAPVAGVSSVAPAAPVSAIAPVAPQVPAAPEVAGSGLGKHSHDNGFSYAYGFDDEDRFVIVSGKSDNFTMSGSTQDARHVERLKKQIHGDFIWLQRDEKSYIIRDQATIDRARAFWAPQEELGKQQEELGKQQEVLGKQQEELGAKMAEVRVNVPDMTAELDRLKAKLQKLGARATMDQIGELQSEIGELQSKIGEIQSEAGDQQSKLGALQGQLGEKQGKLGEQQGELGRRQGELAEKATRQMRELIDETIKNGTAKPEEEMVKGATL